MSEYHIAMTPEKIRELLRVTTCCCNCDDSETCLRNLMEKIIEKLEDLAIKEAS